MQGSEEEEEEEAGTQPVPKLWLSGEDRSRAGSSAAAPPDQGSPSPYGPRRGAGGEILNVGAGWGARPTPGTSMGQRRKGFVRELSLPASAAPRGGPSPLPNHEQGQQQELGVLFWGETRRTPRCPEGFAGALPTQDKARAQHQWQGFARAPPPPACRDIPASAKPPRQQQKRAAGPGGGLWGR